MNVLWLVPLLALVVGGVAVAALLVQAAASARQLVDELARFGEARPVLARVRTEAGRARSTVAALRRH